MAIHPVLLRHNRRQVRFDLVWVCVARQPKALGNARHMAVHANGGATSDRVGWTAGAGLEFGLWDRWSVKGEYLYVDLGTFSCTIACSGTKFFTNTTLTEGVFRAGLNYRF